MKITEVLDGALDRSVVLGYTNLGSRLRRLWWPDDPHPKAMAGKRVVVTGATAGIGEAMAGRSPNSARPCICWAVTRRK